MNKHQGITPEVQMDEFVWSPDKEVGSNPMRGALLFCLLLSRARSDKLD